MSKSYWGFITDHLEKDLEYKFGKIINKSIGRSLEYYICARQAYFNGFMLVSGVLFHHSIEMVLKAILSMYFSDRDLKEEFRHNLIKMWDEFKKINSEKKLNKFQRVVHLLNEFEEIRYDPGKPHSISHGPTENKPAISYIRFKDAKITARNYMVSIDEMDELFSTILDALDADPAYLKGLAGKSGVRVYRKNNKYKFF